MAHIPLIHKYIISSMFINGAFKLSEVYNCKVTRYFGLVDDMLLTEKLLIVSAHTLAGPYILPFSIYNNLHKLELKIRNKNETHYYGFSKTDKYFHDYLFKIW